MWWGMNGAFGVVRFWIHGEWKGGEDGEERKVLTTLSMGFAMTQGLDERHFGLRGRGMDIGECGREGGLALYLHWLPRTKPRQSTS